jgi:carboxymethylenebutenolidase
MFSISKLSRGLAVLAAGIAIAACSGGDPDTASPEADAARANVDAMAEQHADDTTEPSEAALGGPRVPVVSERLAYAEIGDELVHGHFTFPADMVEPLPGLLVIHEWWGLNDNVRAMADRLAGEGYIVLAVDLYGGQIAATPGEAQVLMRQVVDDPEPAQENIRRAVEFLQSVGGAPKVGSLGWCFGGGWSLNAAMLLPEELDAAVIYYGHVTDSEERLQAIQAPILGLFGAEDQGIPVDLVRRFETALDKLGKDHTIHVYPGADHAFANPTGANYNRDAAEDAWQKSLEFLAQNLKVE